VAAAFGVRSTLKVAQALLIILFVLTSPHVLPSSKQAVNSSTGQLFYVARGRSFLMIVILFWPKEFPRELYSWKVRSAINIISCVYTII